MVFESLVQCYIMIVWWFVLLYNGGLLCCVAEGLEVGDIFDQPFANPTHISRVISMIPFSHRM